jgi:hypothetical protein
MLSRKQICATIQEAEHAPTIPFTTNHVRGFIDRAVADGAPQFLLYDKLST